MSLQSECLQAGSRVVAMLPALGFSDYDAGCVHTNAPVPDREHAESISQGRGGRSIQGDNDGYSLRAGSNGGCIPQPLIVAGGEWLSADNDGKATVRILEELTGSFRRRD